jgi:hypothetical protein
MHCRKFNFLFNISRKGKFRFVLALYNYLRWSINVFFFAFLTGFFAIWNENDLPDISFWYIISLEAKSRLKLWMVDIKSIISFNKNLGLQWKSDGDDNWRLLKISKIFAIEINLFSWKKYKFFNLISPLFYNNIWLLFRTAQKLLKTTLILSSIIHIYIHHHANANANFFDRFSRVFLNFFFVSRQVWDFQERKEWTWGKLRNLHIHPHAI